MMLRSRLWPCWAAVWISACAGPAPLPEGAAPLRNLYWRAALPEAPAPMPQTLPDAAAADFGPAAADRALRRDFQRLPNPRLVLYVHPHFSAAGDPIPGYATWFTVYERALTTRIAE